MSVGHTHAFGNIEEVARCKILGVQGRGRPGDKPFDHWTGEGWTKSVRGDYYDAIHVKGNRVIPFITSPSGGIAPHGLAHLKMLARASRLPGGRDGTRYGLSRLSPRSFFTHHLLICVSPRSPCRRQIVRGARVAPSTTCPRCRSFAIR